MRNTPLFALLSLGLMHLVGCAATPDRSQSVESAKALDREFVQAFNQRNADAVMRCYWNSPSLVLYPPDAMEAHGSADVQRNYVQTLANMPKGELMMTDAHYMPAGDVVFAWGTWKLATPNPANEMHGRFTEICGVRDGKWVYLVDHASVPMTPPAGSPPR